MRFFWCGLFKVKGSKEPVCSNAFTRICILRRLPENRARTLNSRVKEIKSGYLERGESGLSLYKDIILARSLVLEILKRKVKSSKTRGF